MATQVFFDANFKVKSLEPVFKDFAGLQSPVALLSATPTQIKINPKTKAILLRRDVNTSGNKIKVEVSKTAHPGPGVAELGNIQVNFDVDELLLSVENITFLILTNLEATTRNINIVHFNS